MKRKASYRVSALLAGPFFFMTDYVSHKEHGISHTMFLDETLFTIIFTYTKTDRVQQHCGSSGMFEQDILHKLPVVIGKRKAYGQTILHFNK